MSAVRSSLGGVASVLGRLAVGAVVSALPAEDVVLTFESEERVGDVVVRTVFAPCDLHEDCGVPVTVLARAGVDFWVAVATGERDHGEIHELLEADVGRDAAVQIAAAFGMPWREVSISALLGQIVLVSSIEEGTARLLGTLDADRLVKLRDANPQPADVLRCLRLMRQYGAAGQ